MIFIYFLGKGKTQRWKRNLFGQESYFLWGDKLERFTVSTQKINDVFWIILIGFIISFLASTFRYPKPSTDINELFAIGPMKCLDSRL